MWDEVYQVTATHLRRGDSVVLDSMALTQGFRERHLTAVSKLAGFRPRCVAIFIDTPLGIALERNRTRSKVVLEQVVREMAVHLQPPTLAEGLDDVIRVSA